ncbi:uncharacterized protein LOC110696162 [Chenopodium quinoa]|uniref:uncharacterized protein LOC110696162 n=1 Tax=Chenopodium quinoa TaxID=63459 RepID=UPI000B798CD7|nr:uncharacterized protein LOC110696162 [Chenopodium quinoa]
MDDKLLKEWERLKLTDEENFVLGQVSASSTEEGSNSKIAMSLVGMLLTRKPFNVEAMKRVLKNLWRKDENVAIRKVKTNLFIFQFFNVDDRRKVLDGRPWVFDNQILLLKEICANEQPSKVTFDSCPFWIRLIDVPFGLRSPQFAHNIGDCIEECIEIDKSDPLCWEEYIRVKVLVNITKSHRRGMKVVVESGSTKWVGFKYERLGDFCYYCGRIGHTVKDCEEKDKCDAASPIVFQYGPFLSASPHRSKVSEAEREKEKGWIEKLNSKGRMQRSDYNDPKAIRLGSLGATRKLLFRPQSVGDGKMVLRPVSILVEGGSVSSKDSVQVNMEHVNDGAGVHKELVDVANQAVDMDVAEVCGSAVKSRKRRLDAVVMDCQKADASCQEKKLKWSESCENNVESVK